MVCALYENDPLLLVSGGFNGTYLSDAIVINLQSKASRVFVPQSDLGFTCYDQAELGKDGEVYGVVEGEDR